MKLSNFHEPIITAIDWLATSRGDLAGEARASLAALDDERAGSGEIRNARAAICLADGDPARAAAGGQPQAVARLGQVLTAPAF
jgi:hypothetical protein